MLEQLSEKKKDAVLTYPFVREYVQARMHRKMFFAQQRNSKAREKYLAALESFVHELKDRGFSDEEIEMLRELGNEDKSRIHAAAAILHAHNFNTRKHPELAKLLIHHATDLQVMEQNERDKLDVLLDRFAVLEHIIDESNWKDIAKLAREADGKLHRFFINLTNSGIKTLFDEREQRIILNILLKFMTHAKISTEQNIETAPQVFISYAARKKKEGLPLEDIPVKEYFAYLQALKHKKVLGSIKEGELVTIHYEQDKFIYRVVKATPEGYLLKRADLEKAAKIQGPFAAKDIKRFEESEDWTSVSRLKENGFIVVHATNAYTKIDAIEGLNQNIAKQGSYSISCSTIHPKYRSNVVISDEPLKHAGDTIIAPHAIGIVLSEGKIYAAYMRDADTYSVHKQYKKGESKEEKVPVRMAVTTKHEFNELLLQKWKIGGLFYTKSTPAFRIGEVREIAAQHKLSIYIIDENKNTWKELPYDAREEVA